MSHYDYFAAARRTYIGQWTAVGATAHFCRLVERSHPAAHDVLEIGPGKGWMAQRLLAQGRSYTCYEPNAELAAGLGALGAVVKRQSVPPLDEPDACYDVFLASHVLEHMATPDRAYLFVSEAYRVLRPGGVAGIVSPDYSHWGRDFFDCDYTHVYPVTANRLRQLMSDAGFSIEGLYIRYGNFGWFPGAALDAIVQVASGVRRYLPSDSYRLLKASLTFHANVIALGRKP